MSKKHKLSKFLPDQFSKKWFWIYLVMVILTSFILDATIAPLYKFITLLILIVSQWKYNKYVKYEGFVDKFNKFLLVFLILSAITYLSAIFYPSSLVITTVSILLLCFVFVVAQPIKYLWELKDSKISEIKKIVLTIILYLFLSILLILFFSSLYTMFSLQDQNNLYDSQTNSSLYNATDFYFYSGAVYYSIPPSNILPLGFSRLITILEIAFSYIVHIILLGIVISSFYYSKKN